MPGICPVDPEAMWWGALDMGAFLAVVANAFAWFLVLRFVIVK